MIKINKDLHTNPKATKVCVYQVKSCSETSKSKKKSKQVFKETTTCAILMEVTSA